MKAELQGASSSVSDHVTACALSSAAVQIGALRLTATTCLSRKQGIPAWHQCERPERHRWLAPATCSPPTRGKVAAAARLMFGLYLIFKTHSL